MGIKHEGSVWIGGDSAAAWSDQDDELFVRADAKVGYLHDMLLGGVGSARERQVLEYCITEPIVSTYDGDRHLVAVVIPVFREVLAEHGALQKGSEGHDRMYSDLLLGWCGELWHVGSDFQVLRSVRPYIALGSGAQYAYGSLYQASQHRPITQETAEQYMRDALRAASVFSPFVVEPFTVLSLATGKEHVG